MRSAANLPAHIRQGIAGASSPFASIPVGRENVFNSDEQRYSFVPQPAIDRSLRSGRLSKEYTREPV